MAGFVAERVEEAVTRIGPALLRPPGALDEFGFLATCTRCDQCLLACPEGALLKASSSAGIAVGTPYLYPRSMPCFLCATLPCIPACPEGALVWPRRRHGAEELEGPRAVKIGTARIKASLCLNYPAEGRETLECRICVDRCPFPGEAIRISEPEVDCLPHPQVIEEHCTGCGLCVFACPSTDPAIVVDPRR